MNGESSSVSGIRDSEPQPAVRRQTPPGFSTPHLDVHQAIPSGACVDSSTSAQDCPSLRPDCCGGPLPSSATGSPRTCVYIDTPACFPPALFQDHPARRFEG